MNSKLKRVKLFKIQMEKPYNIKRKNIKYKNREYFEIRRITPNKKSRCLCRTLGRKKKKLEVRTVKGSFRKEDKYVINMTYTVNQIQTMT